MIGWLVRGWREALKTFLPTRNVRDTIVALSTRARGSVLLGLDGRFSFGVDDPRRGASCMGVVLPFTPRSAKRGMTFGVRPPAAIGVEQAVLAAAGCGGDRYNVLDAASELLAICRDRYGFTVMQDGLPREPDALANALVALLRGLALLNSGTSRPAIAGVRVYLGGSDLGWICDGSGERTTLIVPVDAAPSRIAEFVRPRLSGTGG